MPEPILTKVQTSLRAAGAAAEGCADASLYRRMAATGLVEIAALPQFNPFGQLQPSLRGQARADLDAGELEIWNQAVAAAGDAFLIGMPMHVAAGTKPVA